MGSANWKTEAEQQTLTEQNAETVLGKLRQFFPQIALSPADLVTSRDEAGTRVSAAVEAALVAKEASLEGTREGLAFESQRYLALVQTDMLWKDHMRAMSFVKDFAGLKAYAGTDPLQVYRKEGLDLFDAMQTSIQQNTAYSFFQYEVRKA